MKILLSKSQHGGLQLYLQQLSHFDWPVEVHMEAIKNFVQVALV